MAAFCACGPGDSFNVDDSVREGCSVHLLIAVSVGPLLVETVGVADRDAITLLLSNVLVQELVDRVVSLQPMVSGLDD